MSYIISDIKIASNALVLLGGEPIASFNEETVSSTIANLLYRSSYLGLLTNHRWRFATKTQQLARLSATPSTKYSYAFALPSDMLYIIKTDMAGERYEVYGDELHSNRAELYIDYIYQVDETKLPAYFIKMLEYYLAFQFAIPLTGDLNKANFYMSAYEKELKRAKFADSTQRPGDAVVASGRYANVRN